MDIGPRHKLHHLAASQRGLFSAAQAATLGLHYAWLSRAATEGTVRRVRHGVYAIAGTPPSAWEPMLAAALGCGAHAVISHSTAASAHRLFFASPVPARLELTVPFDARARPRGVTVHRREPLKRQDIETKYGALITTPCRSLVDMAGRLDRELLERSVDEGVLQNLWRPAEIRQCIDRAPANIPGRSTLLKVLDLRMERPKADSMLEVKVFEALQPLEPFQVHHLVEVANMSYLIDAAWPSHRVGVEIVGRAVRVASRSAFDRERRKLNALAGAGWKIAHLTASMSGDEMISAVTTLMGETDRAGRRRAG